MKTEKLWQQKVQNQNWAFLEWSVLYKTQDWAAYRSFHVTVSVNQDIK